MIRVEVIENFDFKSFEKLKNIKRKLVDVEGKLFVGDTFECSKETCDYLGGDNPYKRKFINVIEVKPIKK